MNEESAVQDTRRVKAEPRASVMGPRCWVVAAAAVAVVMSGCDAQSRAISDGQIATISAGRAVADGLDRLIPETTAPPGSPSHCRPLDRRAECASHRDTVVGQRQARGDR